MEVSAHAQTCLHFFPQKLTIVLNNRKDDKSFNAQDKLHHLLGSNNSQLCLLPSNPALSSKLIGYHISGKFPTGNKALGILSVKGNIRDPVPAAIITA